MVKRLASKPVPAEKPTSLTPSVQGLLGDLRTHIEAARHRTAHACNAELAFVRRERDRIERRTQRS
jgi:hypothetical protein